MAHDMALAIMEIVDQQVLSERRTKEQTLQINAFKVIQRAGKLEDNRYEDDNEERVMYFSYFDNELYHVASLDKEGPYINLTANPDEYNRLVTMEFGRRVWMCMNDGLDDEDGHDSAPSFHHALELFWTLEKQLPTRVVWPKDTPPRIVDKETRLLQLNTYAAEDTMTPQHIIEFFTAMMKIWQFPLPPVL